MDYQHNNGAMKAIEELSAQIGGSMRLLSWNVQGYGNKDTRNHLRNLIHTNDPDVIFLCETKTGHKKMSSFIKPLKYPNFFIVDSIGLSGVLYLLWKDGLSLEIVSSQFNVINCIFQFDGRTKVAFSYMYGALPNGNREAQWDFIWQYRQTIAYPWILLSDMNFILSNIEKSGGNPHSQTMLNNANDFVNTLGVHDISFSGNLFTWTNRRHEAELIQERLDRFLGDEIWFNFFPDCHVYHLAPIASDHSPIVLTSSKNLNTAKKPNKFNKCWLRDSSCKDIVSDNWKAKNNGSVAFKHKSSLKQTVEEDYWKQREKDDLFKFNDRNTSYFHSRSNFRRKKTSIESIKDNTGIWLTDRHDIVVNLRNHFSSISRTSNHIHNARIFDCINACVTNANNLCLMRLPSKEEIKEVVFSMKPWTSPGPDGFPPGFYQHMWDIVGEDTGKMVHCFFQDDCLIFTKANVKEVRNLNTILDDFSKALGQAINFDKSSMDFSKKTDNHVKQEITGISHIKNMALQDKYLGVPLLLQRDKSESFSGMLSKFDGRLSLWKSKHFNQPGRIVLSQNVLGAISSHQMVVFPMPKKVTDRIDSIQRRFFWNKDTNGRKWFPKSWNVVSSPKHIGGLNIRKVVEFNKALLTKLAWRLVNEHDALWVQIMAHKYFPDFNPLSDAISSNGSRIWRGICHGLEIVKKNSYWEIANGNDINIWKDVWIPSLKKHVPSDRYSIHMTNVSQLIDIDTKAWNLNLLNALFPNDIVEQESQVALNTPIPNFPWIFFWKVQLPPKFLHFVLRIIQKCVSTRDKLHKVVSNIEPTCPLCKNDEESCQHLLLDCPVTQRIWFALDHTLVTIPYNNICSWLTDLFTANNFWDAPMQAKEILPMPRDNTVNVINFWQAPADQYLKLNFDASFISQDQPFGFGLILHNNAGTFCGATGGKGQEVDEEQVEDVTALEAMKWAKEKNIKFLELEGDCLNVINAINGNLGSIKWTTNGVVQECILILKNYPNWSCTQVKRDANSVAACLAKHSRVYVGRISYINPPDFLKGKLDKDRNYVSI
ncbi:uncharacterized protein LOC113359854 [Papaver somniferum]|uniref:uncharacterized protein LOC113359854 n=1 Tax=Papaver somniferum TaxID=3469 RepID=UPI000E6F60B0|nr:uncharacterized protein LOC113359854 [Papaver somniferum]